jgi:hypothetical protein
MEERVRDTRHALAPLSPRFVAPARSVSKGLHCTSVRLRLRGNVRGTGPSRMARRSS